MNQGFGNVNLFIRILKERLNDNFIQNWNSELIESSRARTYVLFCIFRLQPYLTCMMLEKFRISLSRLRMSSHRSKVETGRWQKPTAISFNERKCTLCLKLEDEFHFLLECSLYKDLRNKYVKKYSWKNTNMLKFIELTTSQNETIIKKLSMFY